MTPDFAKAQVLRTHHRYENAVELLYSHLAQFPNDPDAFIELALNRTAIPGAEKQALEDARTACGLAPDRPFPLSLQARILSSLNQSGEARRLAKAAIAMEPDVAYYWNTYSIVLCDMGAWKEAEQAARKALELEPDDGTASNLLSLALRRQHKILASEEESMRRLSRDPESAFPFYNLGQSALRKQHYQEAENYFLEAMRLNPELQHVKEGLCDTALQRSFSYQFFSGALKLLKPSGRLPRLRPTLLVFLYTVACMGLWVLPAWAGIPAAFILYLPVLGFWLKRPFGHLILLRNRSSHGLVSRLEANEARMLAGLFGLGALLVTLGLAGHWVWLAAPGVGLWFSVPAFSKAFQYPAAKARIFYFFAGMLVVLLGAWEGFRLSQPEISRKELLDISAIWTMVCTLLLMICIWSGDSRRVVNSSSL